VDTSGPTHGGPDAGPPTTDSLQLVAAVAAVVVVVTLPLGADAAAVHTGELTGQAVRPVVRDTVLVVGQVPAALGRALALGAVGPWGRADRTGRGRGRMRDRERDRRRHGME
jgi:hypothetical protein